MEAAKIEWKSIESVFVVDQVFENINAPQWIDFMAPSPSSSLNDVAWFCRPDCKHPSTAEDFTSPPSSKLLSVSKLIGLADWTRREGTNLKRRGATTSEDDSENRNPNLSTPPTKAGIKSSVEKHQDNDNPRLKATQSAKDLLGGRDIFGKITDFCNDLKKMARVRVEVEVEDQQKTILNSNTPLKPLPPKLMNDTDKESNGKGKLRKSNMRFDDAENIPISLDLNNIKRQPNIRTNPPTPQGFSATRNPTPSKAPKSRLKEREIFQELGQNKTLREELDEKSQENGNASVVAAREGRTMDVFWFLKPCTLSS